MHLLIDVIKLEQVAFGKTALLIRLSIYNGVVRWVVNRNITKNFKFIFRDFL